MKKISGLKKLASLFLVIILLLNLIFFGIGKIKDILFWAIIGLCALSAYFMKKWKC